MTRPRTAPENPPAGEAPPHAPDRGWSWRLLGSFHVTGVFWYRLHRLAARVLPSPLIGVFIAIFTTFFFVFLRKIRGAIASNLVPVLGSCGWWGRQLRIYRTMWSFAWCLTERYERLGTNRRSRIEPEGIEIWNEVARPGRAGLEASGGITAERLPKVAATGVNFISMGALTHSAPAVDIHLRLIRTWR